MVWTKSGNIRGPSSDGVLVAPAPVVVTPATFGATETVLTKMTLAANTIQVGTTLWFFAAGTITGTTPSLLARLRCGTAGTIADAQVCATVAAVMTTATGWQIDGRVTFRAVGASGSVLGNVRTLGDGLATANRVSAQTATVAANTAGQLFVSLTAVGGGTSPVVTVVQADVHIIRA